MNKGKKQINHTKSEAKKIRSDIFTRSNREKSSIAIAILEKFIIYYNHFVLRGYQ